MASSRLIFRHLRLDGPLGFLKKVGWFLVAAALLGVAVFLPVLAAGDASVELTTSVGLNTISSVATILVAALAQQTYLWLHSTPAPQPQKGAYVYNPVYNPGATKSLLGRWFK